MINNALTLDEIKQIEVGVLEYVSSICAKYDLRYYLSYGTLIGAIRHKGFIPWDDDIDIAMPREDYERLIDILLHENKNSKYECLVPLKDGYFYEFAKVIDTTTIVQEQQTITAKCGVWIDIFPLDGLRKEDRLCHNKLLLYNRLRAASVNAHFPHKTSGIKVPFEYCVWKLCRWIGFKPFLRWSISLAKKYKYEDCEFVGFASSYPAYNKYMKKEWFEISVDVEFEGKMFKAPIGYHEYLTTQYGDYMQLPPEDKRISHHMEAYRIEKNENISMNNNNSEDELLLKQFYSRYGGYWRFPDMLDYCYLVNPYFNRSAIIKEMQDFFPILVSEYPSGMGINSGLASECWNIKQEHIVVGNGAAELIKAIMESLEGKVGVVRPTFEEYPNRMPAERVETFVPQNDMFRYGADDLIEYFGQHPVDTLLLINPDNPSGNFVPVKGIHKVAQWCEDNGIQFILDESFVDFSVGYEQNTFLHDEILEKYPHMCVMKSISKSYGVPGLRLGILCSADEALIARMKKQVSIWNINSFAEFFMQIYPKYRKDYKHACDQFIQTREDFEEELKKIPFIKVMPSQANYFFLEVLPPYKPKELCAILLKKYNILASACLAKKGIEPNRYMRIAVRNHGDNAKFIQALKELVK